MTIELNEQDILKEIHDNYRDHTEFIWQIIDEGTTNFESLREVTKRCILYLKDNDEVGDLFD